MTDSLERNCDPPPSIPGMQVIEEVGLNLKYNNFNIKYIAL